MDKNILIPIKICKINSDIWNDQQLSLKYREEIKKYNNFF